MPTRKPRKMLTSAVALLALGATSACAVKPQPVADTETAARVAEFKEMLTVQPMPTAPVTMEEAIARALRYNLSSRIKEVEEQMAENRMDAGIWAMLPKANVVASHTQRNNTQASSSRSVTTGAESLETSTSIDRIHQDADLRVSWNILDFGVGYYTNRQMANQMLIAEQRRKKVVQQLVNDVRDAYWKAVSAERLLDQIESALTKVHTALDKAKAIEAARSQPPVEILNYQRELNSKLLQLQGLRRTLVASKLDLAKMMNLPPSAAFKVAIPRDLPEMPALAANLPALEDRAIAQRPELVEETLQERVAADEVRKSIARMFPGLELSSDAAYSSNSYLLHNMWAEASAKLTLNLFNLVSGWDDIDHAELQKELVKVRRQALGMAVVGQVNLAHLDYVEARSAYDTALDIERISQKIEFHKRMESEEVNMGDLELIQMQLNTLLAQMKKDEQYALVQSSLGRLALSVGDNPYADLDETQEVSDLAQTVAAKEREWLSGPWFAQPPAAQPPAPPSVAVASTPSPAATSAPAPAGFAVQLAAFKDKAAAERAWEDLKKRYPNLLAPVTPIIQPADVRGTQMFRVRAGGLATKAAANQLCARLKEHGQDCVLVH